MAKAILNEEAWETQGEVIVVVEVSPKHKRLMEAAASILNHAPDKTLKTVVLNKALFYVDLISLRDFGATISHNTYVALEHGPVIAKYQKRLVNGLEDAGIATQGSDDKAKPIVLKRMPERLEYIDAPIATVIEKVAVWASHQTSKKISDFAHENIGWLIAYQEGPKSQQPPQPINLYLAMQQIADQDPWMDMDYTVAEQAILAADHDWGVPW